MSIIEKLKSFFGGESSTSGTTTEATVADVVPETPKAEDIQEKTEEIISEEPVAAANDTSSGAAEEEKGTDTPATSVAKETANKKGAETETA